MSPVQKQADLAHIFFGAVQYCKVYFREDKKRLLLEQHADGPWYSEFEGFRIADFHMYQNYDWVSLFHIVFLKPYHLQLPKQAPQRSIPLVRPKSNQANR